MKLALSAQLLKVESRSDRTLKIQFNTQELSGEEAAQLLDKVMDQVYLVILDEHEVGGEEEV